MNFDSRMHDRCDGYDRLFDFYLALKISDPRVSWLHLRYLYFRLNILHSPVQLPPKPFAHRLDLSLFKVILNCFGSILVKCLQWLPSVVLSAVAFPGNENFIHVERRVPKKGFGLFVVFDRADIVA